MPIYHDMNANGMYCEINHLIINALLKIRKYLFLMMGFFGRWLILIIRLKLVAAITI